MFNHNQSIEYNCCIFYSTVDQDNPDKTNYYVCLPEHVNELVKHLETTKTVVGAVVVDECHLVLDW